MKLGAGTLYRSLQRMIDQGLVRETDTRPAGERRRRNGRRYYRLTTVWRRRRPRRSRSARRARQTCARQRLPDAEVIDASLSPASASLSGVVRAACGDELRAEFDRRRRDAAGPGARMALWLE
jgi:hypothetical protein